MYYGRQGDGEEADGIRYGCSGIVLCSEPVHQCIAANQSVGVGGIHTCFSLNQHPRIDFEKVWIFEGVLNLLLVWLEKDSGHCSGLTGGFP